MKKAVSIVFIFVCATSYSKLCWPFFFCKDALPAAMSSLKPIIAVKFHIDANIKTNDPIRSGYLGSFDFITSPTCVTVKDEEGIRNFDGGSYTRGFMVTVSVDASKGCALQKTTWKKVSISPHFLVINYFNNSNLTYTGKRIKEVCKLIFLPNKKIKYSGVCHKIFHPDHDATVNISYNIALQ